MDNIHLLPRDIQKLLLMKENEFGQLKFISSRATEETSCFINELLDAITDIVKKYKVYDIKVFYEDNSSKPCAVNPNYVNIYNHFVMNTNFSSQYDLANDIIYGHLVNFWPTLSPYLFIQIIWHLKYEDLLIESLMHLPLDVCVEILEITIRCINELETIQNRRFVFLLISKLYFKCLWLKQGTLSKRDVTELAYELVAHFQTLLNLVSSKFINSKSSRQEKYIQHGILLKHILRCLKICMTKSYPEKDDSLQEFKITYGNPTSYTNHFCILPSDKSQSIEATIEQELIILLQDQIKQIDYYEFMEWAEVDDEENDMFSLQRAVIIECHCFMEFMKSNEFLSTNDYLLHCLQQLVGSIKLISIQELCDSIVNGTLDQEIDMKDLINRYKEWDMSVLQIIYNNPKLLDKAKDLDVLFEYLHYIFGRKCSSEKEKYIVEENMQAYKLIWKILLQKGLSTMCCCVSLYTLRHFHDNRLACLFNSKKFTKFIESDINIQSDQEDQEELYILLNFLMLNPKEVLTTLVRVSLGSTETIYRNVMFKRFRIAYLHAFLLILKLNDQNMLVKYVGISELLVYLLNDAWLHDHSTWCYKNFEAFITDMLNYQAITPDNLLNNVYIPFLASDIFNYSNLLSVLMHMFSILKKRIFTYEANYGLLLIKLNQKMSLIRKYNPSYLRNTMNNLLNYGNMILKYLFSTLNLSQYSQFKITSDQRNCFNRFWVPANQMWWIYFEAPELQKMLYGTVQDVIQNYERRCHIFVNCAKYSFVKCKSAFCKHRVQINRRSLARRMMLHTTEEEYQKFALEMTIESWAYFGWANEMVAYENVLLITTEAIQLALVFTDIFPKGTFISLLRALVKFCSVLSLLRKKDQETIYNMLSKTLFSLKNIVNQTQYSKIYDNLLECINNMSKSDFIINELIEMYFIQCEKIESEISEENKNSLHSIPSTSKTVGMLKEYLVVCKYIDEND